MDELKVGDVVQLKSGSPTMTVVAVLKIYDKNAPVYHADVQWFEGNELKENHFAMGALKKVAE